MPISTCLSLNKSGGEAPCCNCISSALLVFDELEAAIDPNAARSFRMIEQRAKRDFNQNFFARPGRGLPQRAPDLSKAVGG